MAAEWPRFLTSFKPTQAVKRPVGRRKKIRGFPQDTSGTSARTAAATTPAITVLPITPTRQADNSCEQHEGSECSWNQTEKENEPAPTPRSPSVPPKKRGQYKSYTLAFRQDNSDEDYAETDMEEN